MVFFVQILIIDLDGNMKRQLINKANFSAEDLHMYCLFQVLENELF